MIPSSVYFMSTCCRFLIKEWEVNQPSNSIGIINNHDVQVCLLPSQFHDSSRSYFRRFFWNLNNKNWNNKTLESHEKSKCLMAFFLCNQAPQQNNDYDCGVFVLYFIEKFMEIAPSRIKKNDFGRVSFSISLPSANHISCNSCFNFYPDQHVV